MKTFVQWLETTGKRDWTVMPPEMAWDYLEANDALEIIRINCPFDTKLKKWDNGWVKVPEAVKRFNLQDGKMLKSDNGGWYWDKGWYQNNNLFHTRPITLYRPELGVEIEFVAKPESGL